MYVCLVLAMRPDVSGGRLEGGAGTCRRGCQEGLLVGRRLMLHRPAAALHTARPFHRPLECLLHGLQLALVLVRLKSCPLPLHEHLLHVCVVLGQNFLRQLHVPVGPPHTGRPPCVATSAAAAVSGALGLPGVVAIVARARAGLGLGVVLGLLVGGRAQTAQVGDFHLAVTALIR